MTDAERDRRNQTPTPEATFAMYHWHDQYAAQRGGSMDFYDALDAQQKEYCRLAVFYILFAKDPRLTHEAR